MPYYFDPDRHHRRSIRLRGYDYSQSGVYFLTICAAQRRCLFGAITDGTMHLNDDGRIAEEEWLHTPVIRPNVALDSFVVMPNHLHGIVVINAPKRGVSQYAPTTPEHGLRSPSQTIGAIVRGFKSATTKRINLLYGTNGVPVWQHNYYEHIVRDENDLNRIRRYIANNPLRWTLDRFHPNNPPIEP